MSMAAPRYMSNEEYLKWYDFEKDTSAKARHSMCSTWYGRRMRSGNRCSGKR